MKFLILNTDYPKFLSWLYAQHPGLEQQPYEEQMRVRNESLFGDADFYPYNLRKLGHKAWGIYTNNKFMQRAWSKEHSVKLQESESMIEQWRHVLDPMREVAAKTPLRLFKPLFRSALKYLNNPHSWLYDILRAQIKYYKPDILLNQLHGVSGRFLLETKPYMRLLVAQIASPLPQEEDFSVYDLVISSLPNFVEYFRQNGLRSEFIKLGFEPCILKALKNDIDKIIPVSFVGSFYSAHANRIRLLNYLCTHADIKIWGQGIDSLPQDSAIRHAYIGSAWGIQMYHVICNSKITLNHHIDVAEHYANNMRLYEATGVGTLLITDWKVNLHEMFEPGKEVIAYRTPEECRELIRYYLEHDEEREAIARAGQQRTLREHTYYQRMQELVKVARKYL